MESPDGYGRSTRCAKTNQSKKEEITALNAKISDLNKKLEHARAVTSLLSEDSDSRKVKKIQNQLQSTKNEKTYSEPINPLC